MKAQIVSFHCVIRDTLGKLLSTTYNQDVITGVKMDEAPLQRLSEGLRNLKKGQRRKIPICAEDAYGLYRQELLVELPRKSVPNGARLSISDTVQVRSNEGELRDFRVVKANSSSLTLDGNHPFAGQDLVFDIEATDVKDASPEDVSDFLEQGQAPNVH